MYHCIGYVLSLTKPSGPKKIKRKKGNKDLKKEEK
jgi:hypothetical protein